MAKYLAGVGISMARYDVNCPLYLATTGYSIGTNDKFILLLACLQLGLGDTMDRNIPAQIPIDGCLPKNIACGWWHTLLLAEVPI